ncbi:MAG: metal-dependent hydrolase [Pseudomonadota bacterium]|jgi:L-ascorbate metabolism protein UlaG (beta-lactamase superfamily)
MTTTLQYLGHSGFKIRTPTHTILIDPFLTGNPLAPFGWQEAAEDVTHIILTHGHADHVGDTPAIVGKTEATVVGMVELMQWLQAEFDIRSTEMANLGGSIDLGENVRVKLVPAWHSSGAGTAGHYTGTACGVVIETPGGTIYHAGDTCLFADMALIDALDAPDVALLPIGGRFTMDAKAAAYAAQHFLNAQAYIPMHYGTFPLLAPDASAFEAAAEDCPVLVLNPGAIWEIPS